MKVISKQHIFKTKILKGPILFIFIFKIREKNKEKSIGRFKIV